MIDTVAIVGAGAWGTALAVHLAGVPAPPALRLWARDPAAARSIASARENSRYLPGIALPPQIDVVSELSDATEGASLVVVATPVGALTGIVQALHAHTRAPLVWLCKGFVAATDPPGIALPHRVVAPMWPASVAVISGPSFAEEVARGLAETGRLAVALGGRRETLTGLAGLGDLVLTCTGDLSRNRRVGLGLGRGGALAAILSGLGHVAEGVFAAQAAHTLAGALGVDMPICEAVYRVLYEDLPPRRAVEALLAREPGAEFQ